MKSGIKWQNNKFFRWGRSLFLILGVAALGYVALVLLDSRASQADQTRRFEEALIERPAAARDESPEAVVIPEAKLADKKTNVLVPDGSRKKISVGEGASLGRIEINRVGLSAMVQAGISERTLRRAVGHIPGTPLPGQRGNVGLAAHRDTFFRGLRHVRHNDEIKLTTLNGAYSYRVETMRVVEPKQIEVLAAADHDVLTLVTCYPFNFVGTAPKRFIVRARRVAEQASGARE